MNYLPVKLCLSTTATSRFTSRGGALNLEVVPPKGMPVWLRQTTSSKCLRSLDMFTESPPDCLWPRLRLRPRPRRKICACALLSHRKQAPQVLHKKNLRSQGKMQKWLGLDLCLAPRCGQFIFRNSAGQPGASADSAMTDNWALDSDRRPPPLATRAGWSKSRATGPGRGRP
jgi:hypothetical protein